MFEYEYVLCTLYIIYTVVDITLKKDLDLFMNCEHMYIVSLFIFLLHRLLKLVCYCALVEKLLHVYCA